MTDLDDFFKKKDRKKAHKSKDDTVTATDLFKVLDNAAQHGLTEDLEEDRRSRQPPELGPVLAEVIKPEEASKWKEPLEEEREYDLSNLKIETLQATEEDEAEAAKAAEKDQPAKPTKSWSIPAAKTVTSSADVKIGTPGDRKQEDVAATSSDVLDKKKRDTQGRTSVSESRDGDKVENKTEGAGEHHSLLETVAAGLGSVVDTVVGAVTEMLHLDGKDDKSAADSAPAATSPVTEVKEPAKTSSYVAPHLRNKQAETASSSSHSGPASTPAPLSSGGTPGGKYVPRHVQEGREREEREARLGTASGSRLQNPNKKPDVNSEQDFPSLGGGH